MNDRVSVAEAARLLGISKDAVRQRLRRGTLAHEKDGDGNVFVLLTPNDTAAADVHDGVGNAALLAHIETLKRELELRNEELRRKDHLLAAALERIPAIEPPPDTPSEPRESPETVSPSTEVGEGVERPLGQEKRSWWQRWFGVE